MKRKLIWLFFLLLLFVSSYYREVLFRSINAIMGGESFFYAKTTALPFLSDWNRLELNRLKYILTLGFAIWFMSLSILGLKWSFRSKLAFWIAILLYGLAIVVAAIAIFVGLTFSGFESVYPFLRKIIGIIHNPLPYLLISIAVYAYYRMREGSKLNVE